MTLRHGFIIVSPQAEYNFLVIYFLNVIELLELPLFLFWHKQAHLAPQSQTHFDFQKYIKRSLEEDFKVVVGIRWVLLHH